MGGSSSYRKSGGTIPLKFAPECRNNIGGQAVHIDRRWHLNQGRTTNQTAILSTDYSRPHTAACVFSGINVIVYLKSLTSVNGAESGQVKTLTDTLKYDLETLADLQVFDVL